MHELTDETRKFIYEQKGKLDFDLYMSIRNSMRGKEKRGELDFKNGFNKLAYNFTLIYIDDLKERFDMKFDTFENQKEYFKKLLKISKFCVADIYSSNKGIKYSWLTRKKESYN